MERAKQRILRALWRVGLQVKGSFDSILAKERIDFLYPSFEEISPRTCGSAAWIPDFQHVHLPHLFSQRELRLRSRGFQRIATSAKRIVVSSQSSAQDFQSLYPQESHKLRILPFRVTLPIDINERSPTEVRNKYNIPDNYFIISNQFWAHKNHLTVFSAFAKVHDHFPDIYLVCTGRLHDHRFEDYSDTILSTLNTLGIAHRVRLTGLIPKADQIQLLRGAIALLQPHSSKVGIRPSRKLEL